MKCRDGGGQHALRSFRVAMCCEKDDDHGGKGCSDVVFRAGLYGQHPLTVGALERDKATTLSHC